MTARQTRDLLRIELRGRYIGQNANYAFAVFIAAIEPQFDAPEHNRCAEFIGNAHRLLIHHARFDAPFFHEAIELAMLGRAAMLLHDKRAAATRPAIENRARAEAAVDNP